MNDHIYIYVPPSPRPCSLQAPRTALSPTAAAVALTVRAAPPQGPVDSPKHHGGKQEVYDREHIMYNWELSSLILKLRDFDDQRCGQKNKYFFNRLVFQLSS